MRMNRFLESCGLLALAVLTACTTSPKFAETAPQNPAAASRMPAQRNESQVLVSLLEAMPPSTGFRRVCLYGDGFVIGTFSTAQHWSERGKSFVAKGHLGRFPASTEAYNEREGSPLKTDFPKAPEDWRRFPILKENAKGTNDRIYFAQGEVLVSGRTEAADCAFESGPRLESGS